MAENAIQKSKLYTDVCSIIEQGRERAYSAVSQQMIETYWNIGRRIVEEEQQGEVRAEYGAQIIAQLAKQLTHQYGKGFSARYLRSFRQFYLITGDFQIWKSRFPNLTWTHICKTLRVEDSTAICWYLEMASKEMSNYLLPSTRLSFLQMNSYAKKLNARNNSSCFSILITTRRTNYERA